MGYLERMTHVETARGIAVAADALGREVGAFEGVGEWPPVPAGVEGEGGQPGARRIARTPAGAQQVERLTDVDPAGRRCSTITGARP